MLPCPRLIVPLHSSTVFFPVCNNAMHCRFKVNCLALVSGLVHSCFNNKRSNEEVTAVSLQFLAWPCNLNVSKRKQEKLPIWGLFSFSFLGEGWLTILCFNSGRTILLVSVNILKTRFFSSCLVVCATNACMSCPTSIPNLGTKCALLQFPHFFSSLSRR